MSDEAVVIAAVISAVAGGVESEQARKRGSKRAAGQENERERAARRAAMGTETAPALEQLSEEQRRKRRLSASFLTKGFSRPQLGTPALTGQQGA